MVAAPNSAFPVKMFKLLAESTCAEELLSTPSCVVSDPWSENFLMRHRADLTGESATAKLRAIALVVPLDISSVEASHGRVRRRLVSASNNTNLQELAQANCEWVLAEARRRSMDVRRQVGAQACKAKVRRKDRPKKRKKGVAKEGAAPKAPRSGGACRAFFRRNLGKGKTMKQLHEEYKGMTEEQKKEAG